jgi:hypothetical protein
LNGPFLLLKATVTFAKTGLAVYTKALGAKRARLLFWGGMAVSAIVAVILQLAGV